jgi:hypothetical protein
MRKVYIPNQGGYNYSDAERFGKLIYVTTGNINRFEISSIYRTFVEAMAESDKNDFFMPTSLSVLNTIGGAVFAAKHGRLNLLVFKDGKYLPRELDINSLLEFTDDEG